MTETSTSGTEPRGSEGVCGRIAESANTYEKRARGAAQRGTNVMRLKELWEKINAAVGSGDILSLEEALAFLEKMEVSNDEASDVFFASGYASYMLPTGHPSRARAEGFFMKSLYVQPGHIESILYLAYLLIDCGEWMMALKLLYAVSFDNGEIDLIVCDRIVEARVLSLSRLGMWSEALNQLRWFERRLEEDPDCGLILINLMNVLDFSKGSEPTEALVLDQIRKIVQSE